ncbi:uncharacterized protein G2W53_040707 [Senna tora]|uniref:Uncharacterized protein n=1 Tax=Senna tora TaxID=362788 RepID=A0A834SEI8_9FABA|nr:uncharacterized protein G2W53_040707 [Senna tora]
MDAVMRPSPKPPELPLGFWPSLLSSRHHLCSLKPSLTKNPRSPHKHIPSSLLLSLQISKTIMKLKAHYFPALSSSMTLADTSSAISNDVTILCSPFAMTSSSPSGSTVASTRLDYVLLRLSRSPSYLRRRAFKLSSVADGNSESNGVFSDEYSFEIFSSIFFSITAALSLPPHSKALAPSYVDCLLSRSSFSSSIDFMDVFKHTITVATFKDAAAHVATNVVKLTSDQTGTFADGFSPPASKKHVCASHRHKEMATIKSKSRASTGRVILHTVSKAPLSSFSPPPPSPPLLPLPPLPDRHPVARIFICDEDAGEVAYVSSLPSDEVFIIKFVDMKAQHMSNSEPVQCCYYCLFDVSSRQPNQLSIYDPSKHPFASFSTPHSKSLFNLYCISSFIPSNHHFAFLIAISISHSSTTSLPPQWALLKAYNKRNLNYPSNATSCNGRADVVSSEDILLFASNPPDPH